MKVDGISFRGNYAKLPACNGKVARMAKRGLLPLVLAGGLFLSTSLKGQNVGEDQVIINQEEPTEQVDEKEEDALPAYIQLPISLGLAVLCIAGAIGLSNLITKHELRHWTEEDVKYWSEDHPGW